MIISRMRKLFLIIRGREKQIWNFPLPKFYFFSPTKSTFQSIYLTLNTLAVSGNKNTLTAKVYEYCLAVSILLIAYFSLQHFQLPPSNLTTSPTR